jgi:drug/metabolite transporter (DMT)-like permease
MAQPPSRLKLISAFASVYFVWGSTYLGIRIAIESMPPLLMAGIRFIVAGGILYLWGLLRGHERPTAEHWKSATIIGLMLLLVGNGGLSWSEQLIPTGIAALLVAVSPLWFILLDWMQGGIKPSAGVFLGLLLGTLGIVVLIDPVNLVGGHDVNIVGALVLLGSSVCWAVGSLYSRRAKLPSSPSVANGMEMLIGGVGLLVVGSLAGEWSSFRASAITSRSMFAIAYLIVFGSIIGFSSYVYLLRATTPSRVSTYAYVNPVVAVTIGWLVGGETLGGRVLIAAALIIAAVAAITTLGTRKSSKALERLKETEKGEAMGEAVDVRSKTKE